MMLVASVKLVRGLPLSFCCVSAARDELYQRQTRFYIYAAIQRSSSAKIMLNSLRRRLDLTEPISRPQNTRNYVAAHEMSATARAGCKSPLAVNLDKMTGKIW